MCGRYARGKKGNRVKMPVPFNKGIKFSIISAISSKKVVSALYGEWSTDGDIFESFIEHHLVAQLTKQNVVILDRATFHKMKRVKELIESTGAKLIYLPGYSPDLSPIENMWSKIKIFIRKKAPRNKREFQRVIRTAFLSISEKDLVGWYKHCGYTIQPLRKLL
jgi:transposase